MRNLLPIALVFGLGACGSPFASSNLSSGVTTTSVQAITIGMSEAQVVRLLGAPLSRSTSADGRLTLQFSRPVEGARSYPMLWVHFRNGKVDEVYAKRYVFWGVDHEGVYGLSATHGRWATSAFEQTFPKPPAG